MRLPPKLKKNFKKFYINKKGLEMSSEVSWKMRLIIVRQDKYVFII